MPQATADFAAVGRVARRAEFKGIRMTEVSAKCDPSISAPLEPTVTVECSVGHRDPNSLEVLCTCNFVARSTQSEVAQATVKYLLAYEIQGSEPLADGDIAEFAAANGVLHSWPFLREFLHGLTSRMGYPALALPVFHFVPKPKENKEPSQKTPAKPAVAPAGSKA